MAVRRPRGCHCKRSQCVKKYCECFKAGVYCSEDCMCQGCRNGGPTDLPGPPHPRAAPAPKAVQAGTPAGAAPDGAAGGSFDLPRDRERPMGEVQRLETDEPPDARAAPAVTLQCLELFTDSERDGDGDGGDGRDSGRARGTNPPADLRAVPAVALQCLEPFTDSERDGDVGDGRDSGRDHGANLPAEVIKAGSPSCATNLPADAVAALEAIEKGRPWTYPPMARGRATGGGGEAEGGAVVVDDEAAGGAAVLPKAQSTHVPKVVKAGAPSCAVAEATAEVPVGGQTRLKRALSQSTGHDGGGSSRGRAEGAKRSRAAVEPRRGPLFMPLQDLLALLGSAR